MNKWYGNLVLIILSGILEIWALDTVVEMSGSGFTPIQATNDALCKALEYSTQEKIFSDSLVQKFAVLKDVMITREFGLLEKYEVVSQEQESENHLWRVELKVQINPGAKYKWEQWRQIMQKRGSPAIMFCIQESLDGQKLPRSIGEYQLLQKFEDMGFKVIERQCSSETRDLHERDILKDFPDLQTSMVGWGVDFIIVGQLQGSYVKTPPNSQVIRHDYQFISQMIRATPFHTIGTINWHFSHELDSLQYSPESAGKAGFVEIIHPQWTQAMAGVIIKVWLEDPDKF